ncbi:hypothetical protein PENTCL1PPCAC_10651, partial [Pristionchus entomophagus]
PPSPPSLPCNAHSHLFMNSSSNLFELPSTSSGDPNSSSSSDRPPPPLPPRLKRTRLRTRPIPRDHRRAHSDFVDFVYIEDLIAAGFSRLDKMEGSRSVITPPPPSPSPSASPPSAPLPLPHSTRSTTLIARFRRSTRKLFCCLKPPSSAS